jgi:hypothetical protein
MKTFNEYILESNKVGKSVMGGWYVQASAIDNGNTKIPPRLIEVYNKAKALLPKNTDYDFVRGIWLSDAEVWF